MKKQAAEGPKGGMFSGTDYRNAGGGRGALPGTSWLNRNAVPQPTPAHVQKPAVLPPVIPAQKPNIVPPQLPIPGREVNASLRLPLPVSRAHGLGMPLR